MNDVSNLRKYTNCMKRDDKYTSTGNRLSFVSHMRDILKIFAYLETQVI